MNSPFWKLRDLKHGSEEEYDVFKEIAVCQAKNRIDVHARPCQFQFKRESFDTAATTQDISESDEQEARDASPASKQSEEKDSRSPHTTVGDEENNKSVADPQGVDGLHAKGSGQSATGKSTSRNMSSDCNLGVNCTDEGSPAVASQQPG